MTTIHQNDSCATATLAVFLGHVSIEHGRMATASGREAPQRVTLKGGVGLAVAALAGLLAVAGAMHLPLAANPASAARPGHVFSLLPVPAPNFALTTTSGRTVTLSQFQGHPVVLAFLDPSCHGSSCPPMAVVLKSLSQQLGPRNREVGWIAVNVNPEASPAVLPLPKPWQFLSGSMPELWTVWHQYHIDVALIHHQWAYTGAIYLINRQGQEVDLLITDRLVSASTQARRLRRALSAVLPKGAALAK